MGPEKKIQDLYTNDTKIKFTVCMGGSLAEREETKTIAEWIWEHLDGENVKDWERDKVETYLNEAKQEWLCDQIDSWWETAG